MKRHLRAIAVLLGLLSSALAGATSPYDSNARRFVEMLDAGQFHEAATHIGPPLAQSMDQARLQHDWQNVVEKNGAFLRVISTRQTSDRIAGKGVPVVIVICKFEKQDVRVRLSFDNRGRIISLWFNPAEEKM